MKRSFYRIFFYFITMFSLCISVNAQNVYEPYLLNQNEVLFNQSIFKIDVVDPVASTNWKGINYPGLRGSNQLVIYTPSYGLKTGTNEFGTEAIIVGDTVASLSGANSLIPANGFVISGHGQAKKWINENIMVGAKISIDLENKTITSYITSDTFLYSAKEKIKDVQNMMYYYSQTCNDYSSRRTESNLSKANDFIMKAQKDSENSQKYSSKAIDYANLAMSTVIPYSNSELKGLWIRPTYFSEKEIEDALDEIEKSGFDTIFIETYYHGKTIFPSSTMEKYGFIKQYEDFVGFDPLRIWITEARKRNIKVHIWFQTYYVGNKPPETNPEYILAKRPDWANIQKKNVNTNIISYSVSEHNGYFIDPANPEVQEFLYELLYEIVKKYRPDGINLDYIRYPQSLSPLYSNYDMSNWGYTNYARKEFRDIYGIDPVDIKSNDENWAYWRHYRCSRVTNFVKRISSLCRSNQVMLTTVIFPNRANAIDTKLQDWKNWSVNDFVDGFTPLLLTCDDKTATSLIEEVLRNKSASTKLFAGLFVTFMNGSNSDLIKQIHVTRKYSLNGLILFDYAHLNQNYIQSLTESVFRPSKKDLIYSCFDQKEDLEIENDIDKKSKGKKKRGKRRKK